MLSNLIENLSVIEILRLTIIGEARGEAIEGQVAVGCVIRNRLQKNPNKYKSLKDVCLEPKQFSCWNESDPNYNLLIELGEKMITNTEINDLYLKQCIWVASGIVNWQIIDNTGGALHYFTKLLFHSPGIPVWAKNSINPKEIGNQIFFNV